MPNDRPKRNKVVVGKTNLTIDTTNISKEVGTSEDTPATAMETPTLDTLSLSYDVPHPSRDFENDGGEVTIESIISGFMDACGVGLAFDGAFKTPLTTEDIKREMKEIFTNTPMFELTEEDLMVQYRNKLGEGAFCNVYPVHVRNRKTDEFNPDLPPFALKKLKQDIIEHPGMLARAYEDLAQEANIMSSLRHDNVIKMFGMSHGDIGKDKFFVLVEKLQTTLESKLEKWAKIRGPLKKITPKDTVLIRVRDVAVDIARGLEYIRSHQLIYRDLKPGNVGFDNVGKVKIFDFGLAIEVSEGAKIRGKAGTLRYMAPEMRSDKPYDHSVDVYSFGALLWQIITSRTPFEKEIPETEFFMPKDVPADKRPNLKYVESKDLKSIVEMCWSTNPDTRWTFDKIIQELNKFASSSPGRPISVDSSKSSKSKGRFPRLSSFKVP